MKKTVFAILCVAFVLFGFTACQPRYVFFPYPSIDDDNPELIGPQEEVVVEYDLSSAEDLAAIDHGYNSLEYDSNKNAAKLNNVSGNKAYIWLDNEVPTADKSLVLTYDLVISKNGNERVSFNHNFVVGTNHYCQAMVAFVPSEDGVEITKDIAGTGAEWGTLPYSNGDELNVSVKAEYGYDSESSEYYVSLSVGNLEPQVVRTTTEPSDIFWCYYYGNDADNYISNIKVVRE